MALATIDAAGCADLSPKGDPAGAMAHIAGDQLWFADRPGNRRADSFRNIIAQPRIAAALLIPGSSHIAIIRGTAMLTDDANARASFEVQGKVRSEERRVGKECVSKGRSRWSPGHQKEKHNNDRENEEK